MRIEHIAPAEVFLLWGCCFTACVGTPGDGTDEPRVDAGSPDEEISRLCGIFDVSIVSFDNEVLLQGSCTLSAEHVEAFNGFGITRVTQNLVLRGAGAISIEGLTEVDSSLSMAGDLTQVALPALSRVGDTFSANQMSDLVVIAVPALRVVEGTFQIRDNEVYPQCDAEAIAATLERVGATDISNNCLNCCP